MEEVEILWTLNESIASAAKKLSKAKYERSEDVVDEYFTHSAFPELKPTPDGKLLGSLRVRTKKDRVVLTYKKDYFEDGVWSHSGEQEEAIGKDEDIHATLREQGFEPLITLRIRKHIYTTPKFTIVLEELQGIWNFIEIETRETADSGTIKERKERIREFLRRSDVAVGEELNIGKPEFVLRKTGKSIK